MTGFRSGKSGGLIRGAKAAGRAIGKRKAQHRRCLSPASLPVYGVPPPFLLSSLAPPQDKPRTPRRIMAQEPNPQPLRPDVIRPQSDLAEMWKDYSVFKAAGLLSEWRKKWAGYLVMPV